MARIRFREVKLSATNKQRLGAINSIIAEYQKQGYVLTLRQLYYQLVSRDVIPNKQAEYAKLSNLLKEGRMGGIVDWNAIEDRLRKPYTPASFDSPKDILEAAINQYQLPRMNGQKNYVEVWVEKDALSGVLKRVTSVYHVPILVNRGYSSASAMFDSYKRFAEALHEKRNCYILYLGDFDPSGVDMIRDVRDRTLEFFFGDDQLLNLAREATDYDNDETRQERERLTDEYEDQSYNDLKILLTGDSADDMFFDIEKAWLFDRFKVIPIALTREQIKQYKPPPNPAKHTDPRAKDFIAEHGSTSWEVDALRPEVLNAILTLNIERLIDINLYKSIVKKEETDKKKLKSLMKNF